MSGAPITIGGVGNGAASEDWRNVETTPDAAPGSLHDRLIAAGKQHAEQRIKLDVEAGPYAGLVRIEYRPLPWDLFERIAAKLSTANDVGLNLDVMAQCCVCVIGVHADGLEEVLDDGNGPMRLDDSLARYMQMQCAQGPIRPTARDVVKELFGGNGMAIGAHATELLEWMRAPERHGEVDAGKS